MKTMNDDKLIWRISYEVEQIIRFLSMRFVLTAAAYSLPKKFAIAIADLLAISLLILPKPGMEVYWEMRRVFGKGRRHSLSLAYGWLARPFRDFVVLKRILYEREDPFAWKIVEKNSEGVNSLRKSGESYIVASGHFSREAVISMFSTNFTYGNPILLCRSTNNRIHSLHDLQFRLRLGALLGVQSYCWGRRTEFVYVGSNHPFPFRKLHKRLCEKGNVVFIGIDAWWKTSKAGAYERPFAGHLRRPFATGTAQLARLTGCPIVSCVYKVQTDGSIEIEWGPPIRIDMEGNPSDIEIMNELLDRLEIAIGKRPTEYVMKIGNQRRWNCMSERWE